MVIPVRACAQPQVGLGLLGAQKGVRLKTTTIRIRFDSAPLGLQVELKIRHGEQHWV